MFKGTPYSNKIIKRREQQRLLLLHKQNLKNIRPIMTNFQFSYDTGNLNKKKDMLQEGRFTEIERQNRMLLQKINTIMTKKPTFKVQRSTRINSTNNDKQKMNKSLNHAFRNKQLQDIEIQNAKLLKRIMDKKSDYEAQKLKQEWKKQKQVIKNIANYPFIIRDKVYKGRRKSSTSHSSHQVNFIPALTENDNNLLANPVQIVRIRKLQNENFLITVKYDGIKLQILGDNKSKKEIKVIQIPKDQAMEFIHFECDDKIENIFDCLRYSSVDGVLYLVGKGVEIDKIDQKQQKGDDQVIEKVHSDNKNQQKEQVALNKNKNQRNEKQETKQGGNDKKINQRQNEQKLQHVIQKGNTQDQGKQSKTHNHLNQQKGQNHQYHIQNQQIFQKTQEQQYILQRDTPLSIS